MCWTGLAPLLAAAAIVAGCGSSSDSSNGNKATLIQHVEEGLEARNAPPQYTDCIVGHLQTGLDNTEVERAYDAVPSGANGREFAAVAKAVGPSLVRAFKTGGLECARQLVKSGDYTPAEVVRIMEQIKTR